MICEKGVNSLPNDNFLDWTKLRVFADDNLYAAQMMIYVSFTGSLKVVIVW